jgi:phosphonate metabolism protein PhnN/1,5-bisphosphokinase (PRPP-forming)
VPAFEAALAAGQHVVVNVSRDVVEAARLRFDPVRVIEVTAPVEVLAARLKARGREDVAAIGERLARARVVKADATVLNDGALEAAVAAFIRALQG